MKKLVIISGGYETSKSLTNQLKNILKENIDIKYYSENDLIPTNIECDLIVFSSKSTLDTISKKLNITQNYVIVQRTIQYELVDKLFELENNTNVLLVNDSKDTCDIAIKQLNSLGVEHLIYHPYYPGIENYPNFDIVVTPGEEKLIPIKSENIINIGTRQIDIVSIMEIIINLGQIEIYKDLISSYFFRKMVNQYKKYIDSASKSRKLTSILTDILDNSIQGIIYTNTKDEVLVYNQVANDILELDSSTIGQDIYSLCPLLRNDLATINDNEIFITTKKIYSDKKLMGNMITFERALEIEKMDDKLRRKKKQSNNIAKYTFKNMIGNNENILKLIKLSRKISKSNSTILIQGESGTGKEILAQSIHNESDRREYPFVAINFSALPESLLESELFGYEEGAFTGAKKGGKVGLFKKAHKGTIFLDEIGDAPYHFQTKLLRVLQEREITPVGSSEPIPIDLRVIAATNKDLTSEVIEKNFREDLFYRLNVMPLYTISLRDRKDDIEAIIKYYLKKLKIFIELENFVEEDVLTFFKLYDWPGNIRELINIIEYLGNIREDDIKIKVEDLPKYMTINYKKLLSEEAVVVGFDNNIDKNSELNEKEMWILNNIYLNEGIGRRALCKLAASENLDYGEGVIRTILNTLRDKEYIEINRGLKGTRILEKGMNSINNGMKKG
ncbi:MAG: sigma-54 interaction domain-containing protein [Paraclostridium sp.]